MEVDISKKLDKFFKNFKQINYKKGEILIRAEEQPRGIFYLTVGLVKKYAISQKGDVFVINIFKPNSFFPISWAINDTRNKYFYEATTDVQINLAPRINCIEFLKKEPEVLYDLIRRVYTGIEGVEKRMIHLMGGSAYTKLIMELIIQANRFGVKKSDEVILQIKESDLATQSGITRETVSREIKILKEKGIIALDRKHLIIISLTKLEEELLSES